MLRLTLIYAVIEERILLVYQLKQTDVWTTDVSCQADILMATLSDMEKEQEALH